jgi:hypothetical protein
VTTLALVTDDGRAVLAVVLRYPRSWRLLMEYDEEPLAEVPERLNRSSRFCYAAGCSSSHVRDAA